PPPSLTRRPPRSTPRETLFPYTTSSDLWPQSPQCVINKNIVDPVFGATGRVSCIHCVAPGARV
ncbi:MAG: hypothetical protein AAFN80_15560, partial [Pseudomonadota bacterium]